MLAHLETRQEDDHRREDRVLARRSCSTPRTAGIEVYLFTWNIFVWGTEGKYGITVDQNNPTTIDYFRKSVRETC